ncbi:MAG: amino acid adenylation domain-containing protein, partial [Ruminococcus sp.]
NGKLDKRALPDIQGRTGKEYIAPRNETEEILCHLFKEILSVEQVGVKDSFFELGGHSLRAIRLVNRIEELLGTRLSMKTVFAKSTPEELARIFTGETEHVYEGIPQAAQKESYPMSSAQKRIYLVQCMDPTSTAYNIPQCIRIIGNVDVTRMKETFQKMIDRHEILRTCFLLESGNPVQKILKNCKADFTFEKVENTEISSMMKQFVRPFSLEQGQTVRMYLAEREEDWLLLLDMHHIVSDGMSMNTFMQEFSTLYNGKTLSVPARQYKDYSEWMQTRDLHSQEAYWLDVFEDEIPVLDLPLDFIRPQMQSNRGNTIIYDMDDALIQAIQHLAKETGTTEYMVYLSALMIMLSKYAKQDDIVVGSPVSGRTHRDMEDMLGVFINTLAMRGKPEAKKYYKDFLLEIKEVALKAYENQEYPYEELVEKAGVRRDASRNPLFDVLLVVENNEATELVLGDTIVEQVLETGSIAKYDLSFNISRQGKTFFAALEYCTDLFTEESGNYILHHFIQILQEITRCPNQKLEDIAMLTVSEQQMIADTFNNTATDYNRNQTAVHLFEEQVRQLPDKVALEFGSTSVTYQEFSNQVNALAAQLRKEEIRPDDFVVIMAERSIEMMLGIFGILKSGGAYVPIDPSLPQARIDYILQDCQAKAVVIYGKQAESAISCYKMQYPDADFIILNLEQDIDWSNGSKELVTVNKPEDLAYMIYTSGTTGNPKGVMIEHKGILNLYQNWVQDFNVTNEDKVLLFANITFDASVGEMTMALLTGGTLCIPEPDQVNNVKYIEECIAEKQLSIMAFPTHFAMLLNYSDAKFYLTAGSEANREAVEKIVEKSDFINSYGPTETTVCATFWRLPKGEPVPEKIPIGKPHKNTKIYIMDGNVQCGIGVPGELCIVRDGVARGYLNRPELTAEKFVSNPFGEGKMYRSGDLARWLPDGNIEYMGRIDQQVKIHGFRIELGEIESVLRKLPNVKDCAVITRENGADKLLCAYVVMQKDVLDVNAVKAAMQAHLPDYMIPSYMMQIDSIPMTKNGKLNKKALP